MQFIFALFIFLFLREKLRFLELTDRGALITLLSLSIASVLQSTLRQFQLLELSVMGPLIFNLVAIELVSQFLYRREKWHTKRIRFRLNQPRPTQLPCCDFVGGALLIVSLVLCTFAVIRTALNSGDLVLYLAAFRYCLDSTFYILLPLVVAGTLGLMVTVWVLSCALGGMEAYFLGRDCWYHRRIGLIVIIVPFSFHCCACIVVAELAIYVQTEIFEEWYLDRPGLSSPQVWGLGQIIALVMAVAPLLEISAHYYKLYGNTVDRLLNRIPFVKRSIQWYAEAWLKYRPDWRL